VQTHYHPNKNIFKSIRGFEVLERYGGTGVKKKAISSNSGLVYLHRIEKGTIRMLEEGGGTKGLGGVRTPESLKK